MTESKNVEDMLMDIDSLDGEEDADVSMTDRDEQHSREMKRYAYQDYNLDCYPYTFSPLLLFSTDGYFDRGYSNYNAVASFFDPVLRGVFGEDGFNGGGSNGGSPPESNSPRRVSQSSLKTEGGGSGIDMLEGVVYERKNMT
jgi:hypothetical protein